MGQVLPKPELVPYNRVHAMELEQELSREYSKHEWRQATQAAIARWKAEGNRIQVVKASDSRRVRYVVEE